MPFNEVEVVLCLLFELGEVKPGYVVGGGGGGGGGGGPAADPLSLSVNAHSKNENGVGDGGQRVGAVTLGRVVEPKH